MLLARSGVPVAVLVTEEFEEEARFVGRACGMPGVPMIVLPHPVAGMPAQFQEAIAERVAPECLGLLEGTTR